MERLPILRMCIACREMKQKSELIRIVKNAENTILIDKTGKAGGRGAYICKNASCSALARKKKGLNKAFSCMVGEDVYDMIDREINDTKE